MVAPAPIPHDEKERLVALRGYAILDTAADERFDLFTRLGTWLYDVPVSAINFVDVQRTFFKSAIGFESYSPVRQTSICAHAVGGACDLMMVEDLTKDSRFEDHPLAVKRGIRFYAGAVLKSDTGHAIGTLCIGDVHPRRLGDQEQQKLKDLAKGVGAVLDLHRKSLLLAKSATEDPLTGLANRRAFDDRLHNAILRARSGEPFTLLSLDLDGFKRVNDTLGHAAGDALLCEVGRRLGGVVREGDIVARIGGDEFSLLMSGRSSPIQAKQQAERILNAFAEPFFFEGSAVEIRSSIGIALCPEDARTPQDLLRCADQALYTAKQAGRGQYRFSREDCATAAIA